jgi:CRISPR-associated protein Cas1
MALSNLAPLPGPQGDNALARRRLPEYLPARMVNEFVYCPRLFFYEWVDGLFKESVDTIEGSLQHKRVDQQGPALPEAPTLTDESGQPLKTRALTLSSDRYRLIAKLDLLEVDANGLTTPIDYKHGAPRETPQGLDLWPPDRIQSAIQAILLRENGYRCEEALVFYAKTRQRVRLPITDALITEVLAEVEKAWATASAGILPPALIESPKCHGCSLAPICLPEESNLLLHAEEDDGQLRLFGPDSNIPRKAPQKELRRLLTPRDEQRAVYFNTQGVRIGRSGEVLQARDKVGLVMELRLHELSQLNIMGNVQVTTQALHACFQANIPVCYFSQGGFFYGMAAGTATKNVFLRKAQFSLADNDWFCVRLARQLVAGKIRNQRVMLMRNHIEPGVLLTDQLRRAAEQALTAESLEELLGIEGNAARLYFGAFTGMVKSEEGSVEGMTFDFEKRSRRPPRDPINALLGLAYSILSKDLTIATTAAGFDPMIGFYHQPRFGRPALALDLMEPFRPLIADSVVLSAINTRRITIKDFVRSGNSVNLTPEGRKAFFLAYESRMDTLVTHPLFGYRLSYRRLLEVQARLLGKYLEGTIAEYPVFVTR